MPTLLSLTEIIERLRSLAFGGALGSGMAGLIYLLSPALFSYLGMESVLLVGWLLGSGLHRLLNSMVTGSTGRTVGTMFRLSKLRIYENRGLLNEAAAGELRERIVYADLLAGVSAEKGLEELARPEQEPHRLIVPSSGDESV